jgi:glycosyltransferase involved in cell wall biosynthesis
MKLLVYSHSFAPNVGGIETIVLSLTRGLAELRGEDGKPQFELTLVTQTPAGMDSDDRLLVEFPVIRQPGILRLWRLVCAADVIHVAGPALLPLILARLAGKPAVIEHHGYQAICPNGLLVELPGRKICPGHFQARRYDKCVKCQACEMSWLESIGRVLAMFPRHWLARNAKRNIAISRHEQLRLALPSELIYHGVDDFRSADILAETSTQNTDEICFAFVGRLVPEKDLQVLLTAAELMKQHGHSFQMLLIGDGPERQTLEKNIEQRGLGNLVRCTGFLKGDTFAEVLRRVHVVVMPSAWEETAGLSAIEQMMRGRLVIASRIGGLGEIVKDEGLTFASGNAEELAAHMQNVLSHPEMVTRLGALARERTCKYFHRKRMIEEHARLYLAVNPPGQRSLRSAP